MFVSLAFHTFAFLTIFKHGSFVVVPACFILVASQFFSSEVVQEFWTFLIWTHLSISWQSDFLEVVGALFEGFRSTIIFQGWHFWKMIDETLNVKRDDCGFVVTVRCFKYSCRFGFVKGVIFERCFMKLAGSLFNNLWHNMFQGCHFWKIWSLSLNVFWDDNMCCYC